MPHKLPRELTLRALFSSIQHTDCVYPQQRNTFAGKNAQPVMQSALAQVLVLLHLKTSLSLIWVLVRDRQHQIRLTTENARHKYRCWMTKSDIGSTAHAFMLLGLYVTPPVMSHPSNWSDYTRDSERGHAGGVPIALQCSSSFWRGTKDFVGPEGFFWRTTGSLTFQDKQGTHEQLSQKNDVLWIIQVRAQY